MRLGAIPDCRLASHPEALMWRLVCSIPAALVIVRMAMAFMVIGALTYFMLAYECLSPACHNHNRRTNREKIEPGLLEFMMTKCFGGGESAGRREGHYLVIARFQSSLLVCHPLLS